MMLVLVHVVFTMIATVEIALQPEFTSELGTTATTVAFCVSVALDLTIPIVLTWKLRQFNSFFQSTKSMIRRITIQAISSGFVVALAGIAFIIMFWTSTPGHLVISGVLGRLYSLTILVNLLGRKSKESRKGAPSSSNVDRSPYAADVFNLYLSFPSERPRESVALDLGQLHSRANISATNSPATLKNQLKELP